MSKTKTPTAQQVFERDVVQSAVEWSAFVRIGAGEKHVDHFPSRGGAVARARDFTAGTGRPSLVYAISADGRSVLAGTVNRQGEWQPCTIAG